MVQLITQLFDDLIEGLARLGCGMVGLPYPVIEDDHESQ
jgi:hypothetical protein